MTDVFIISEENLRQFTDINNNVDSKLLKNAVREAQDIEIIRSNTFVVSINNQARPWKDFPKIARKFEEFGKRIALPAGEGKPWHFGLFDPSLIQLYIFVLYHKFMYSTAALVTRNDLPLKK